MSSCSTIQSVVSYLLERGGSLESKDHVGNRPLTHLKHYPRNDVVDIARGTQSIYSLDLTNVLRVGKGGDREAREKSEQKTLM